MNTQAGKVEQDNDELILVFSEDLVQERGIADGDYVDFCATEKAIAIRKSKKAYKIFLMLFKLSMRLSVSFS